MSQNVVGNVISLLFVEPARRADCQLGLERHAEWGVHADSAEVVAYGGCNRRAWLARPGRWRWPARRRLAHATGAGRTLAWHEAKVYSDRDRSQ